VAAARATLDGAGYAGPLDVLRHHDPGLALLETMGSGTMALMGAPSIGAVIPLVGETVPAMLARRGGNPVFVVRDIEPRRAHRFERLFFARS